MSVQSSNAIKTSQSFTQQEGLDKTLILGTLASGVLGGVPAGLAYAIGYLTARETEGQSKRERLTSFLGQVIPNAALSIPIRAMTNHRLISELNEKVGPGYIYAKAGEISKFRDARWHRNLGISSMSGMVAFQSAYYCAKKTDQEFQNGNKTKAAGWFTAALASAASAGMSIASFLTVDDRNSFPLYRTAQITGLSASIFSACKTVQALKENKILQALQWFSCSLCSGTLAYAASHTPIL